MTTRKKKDPATLDAFSADMLEVTSPPAVAIAELAEIPATLPAFELAGPGFYAIDDETYHRGSPGVSKSGLWTIHTKTPAHFQFGERKETEAFQMGSAIHCAILEPEAFESRYVRGPDDRRGNKWTDACAAAAHYGTTCLVSKDYDEALLYREAAHLHPIVRKLTTNAKVETAAFAIDDETGEIIKCKPDVFNEGLNIIADLKSSVSASREDFAKSITNYGYHVQEAMYSDVWTQAGGTALDGFVFIVIEKSAPFLVAVYEIEPRLVEDGFGIYRSALRKFHECNLANSWPGYSNSVERIDAPEWYYRQQEMKGSN
jgi:hypothetical protein